MPGHKSFSGASGASDDASATMRLSEARVLVHSAHSARCASTAARSASVQSNRPADQRSTARSYASLAGVQPTAMVAVFR